MRSETTAKEDMQKPTWYRRLVYGILFIAASLTFAFYGWSKLEPGRILSPSKAFTVRLNIDLDPGSDRSRAEIANNLAKAGEALRAKVEAVLNENGFTRSTDHGPDSFVGRFKGSPEIEVRLSNWDGVDEGGFYYQLAFDYHCHLPRSTLSYQDDTYELMLEFEKHFHEDIAHCYHSIQGRIFDY